MIERCIKTLCIVVVMGLIFMVAATRVDFSMSDTQPAVTPTTDLIYGPYVNAVSSTQASVHWISPAGVAGVCKVMGADGTQVQLHSATIPKRTDVRHTAVITGLKPDEQYQYRVTAGKDHAEGHFRTAPPIGARKDFRFVVTGDTQSWPQRIRTITDAISRETPAFVLHTGDCCDDGQKWSLWEREFFGPARELLRQTTMWNARGNHEKGIEPFLSIFDLKNGWQSFDFGNVHVAVVDQWDVGSDSPMEPDRRAAMAEWLDKDLAAAKGKFDWLIVAGHQGVFNVAGHGSTWGHKDILPILYKHGVDLFVCGHSHLYERFVPIGPPGSKPIQFIVAGGGGGYSYPPSPSPILVKAHGASHYCLYRVNGERLELTVKGTDGSMVDDVVFTKANGVVSPNVLAAAISPEDALKLLKTYKGLAVNVAEAPVAGRALVCSMSPRRFPAGSKVTISTDAGGSWAVETATFMAPSESAESPTTQADGKQSPSWQFKVTPPPGVVLDQDQNFSPDLTVDVELEYKGRKWVTRGVPVGLHEESVRRLTPAPAVADVPPAPSKISLDGDLAEWKSVPALRLASTGKDSRMLKLAWDKDALYGAVLAEQDGVHADRYSPATADGVEICVESDAARRLTAGRQGVPLRLLISPDPEGSEGKTTVHRVAGKLSSGTLESAWRKTPTGYTLEFRISAKGLTPPPDSAQSGQGTVATKTATKPFEVGRTMSFDLILRHDGKTVEQLSDTHLFRGTNSSPIFWSQIRLAEK